MFCDSENNILKENDIVRFPKLADTYQRIAEEGPDVFYNGTMARSIVEDIQAAGVVPSPVINIDKLVYAGNTSKNSTKTGWRESYK